MGTQTERAIIFGAAPCEDWGFLEPYLLRWLPCPVFCADGGLGAALAAGLHPDYLVGDWDSGGKPSEQILCRTLPVEKDFTDLEAAVEHALTINAKNLLLCGCTGGRLDHTAINLTLLERIALCGGRGLLVDGDSETRILMEQETLKLTNEPPYHYLSLIPLDREVRGVTLCGVKYPLMDGVLTRGSTLSVSNEPANAAMTIGVKEGRVLLIRSQREVNL